MKKNIYQFRGTNFCYYTNELINDSEIILVWAHGWGHSHESMIGISNAFSGKYGIVMFDFPAFGESQIPTSVWGTSDYADASAGILKQYADKKIIWIGHSFGCRVGIRACVAYPELLCGLFLISAPGVKVKRKICKNISVFFKVVIFKLLKKIIPKKYHDDLRGIFGSADYKNADSKVRKILVKVVNEDLSETASKIKIPVHFLYGENDTDTPPDIGERFCNIISNAEMTTLPHHDHLSVINKGNHVVASRIKTFIDKIRKRP